MGCQVVVNGEKKVDGAPINLASDAYSLLSGLVNVKVRKLSEMT